LGDKSKSVYVLTLAHLGFSVLNALAGVSIRNQKSFLILLASVPISVTYTIFFSWILNGLSATKESLTARKQSAKLGMYEQLTWILFGFFGAACFFMVGAVFVIITYNNSQSWYASHWNWLWFFSAGWPMFLNCLACIAVGWIFRPQAYNRSYGMDEISGFPLDEEDLDTRANVALDTLRSHRRGTEEYGNMSGKMSGSMEELEGHSRWNTGSLQAFGNDDSGSEEHVLSKK
jgi:hypothetical protein